MSLPGEPPPRFVVAPGEDARATPVQLLFVQGEARPAVDASDEELVMTMPHLVLREMIAFLALSLVLVLAALFFDAPLEEIADPSRTPNPAKAPWYFLGLQELLHYYPPLVSGVLLPGLLIVALAVIPYARVNLERAPLADEHARRTLVILWTVVAALSILFYFTGARPVWPFIGTSWLVGLLVTAGLIAPASVGSPLGWLRSRSLPFWIFTWFLIAAAVLTVVGVLFRGPGWTFTLPWRDGIY